MCKPPKPVIDQLVVAMPHDPLEINKLDSISDGYILLVGTGRFLSWKIVDKSNMMEDLVKACQHFRGWNGVPLRDCLVSPDTYKIIEDTVEHKFIGRRRPWCPWN